MKWKWFGRHEPSPRPTAALEPDEDGLHTLKARLRLAQDRIRDLERERRLLLAERNELAVYVARFADVTERLLGITVPPDPPCPAGCPEPASRHDTWGCVSVGCECKWAPIITARQRFREMASR